MRIVDLFNNRKKKRRKIISIILIIILLVFLSLFIYKYFFNGIKVYNKLYLKSSNYSITNGSNNSFELQKLSDGNGSITVTVKSKSTNKFNSNYSNFLNQNDIIDFLNRYRTN